MILLGLSMYPYLKIFGFVTALQFNIRSHLGGGGGGEELWRETALDIIS